MKKITIIILRYKLKIYKKYIINKKNKFISYCLKIFMNILIPIRKSTIMILFIHISSIDSNE